MVWWWIANVLGLVVVIPLVVLLANRVIAQALEIRQYTDEIMEHGVRLTGTLDPLPALTDTRALVEDASEQAGRYVRALHRII